MSPLKSVRYFLNKNKIIKSISIIHIVFILIFLPVTFLIVKQELDLRPNLFEEIKKFAKSINFVKPPVVVAAHECSHITNFDDCSGKTSNGFECGWYITSCRTEDLVDGQCPIIVGSPLPCCDRTKLTPNKTLCAAEPTPTSTPTPTPRPACITNTDISGCNNSGCSWYSGCNTCNNSGWTCPTPTPIPTYTPAPTPTPTTAIGQCVWNKGKECNINSCGQSVGTYDCYGICTSLTPPPNPSWYLAPCQGPINSCGDYAIGVLGCDGTCSVTNRSLCIQGYIYDDIKSSTPLSKLDGLYTVGEDSKINGIKINLIDSASNAMRTTSSATNLNPPYESGYYVFKNISEGEYRIEIDLSGLGNEYSFDYYAQPGLMSRSISVNSGPTNTPTPTPIIGLEPTPITMYHSYKTPGGTPTVEHSSVYSNGKIYTWGGRKNDTILTNRMDIYSISSDSWSTGLSGGTARSGHTSVLHDGKIYNWGGSTTSGYLNSIDIYDIASNSWETKAGGGTARKYHTAVLYDGKIYYFGGLNGPTTNSIIRIIDIYDPYTDSWTTKAGGGTPRVGHTSQYNSYYVNNILYDKVFFFGGWSSLDPNTITNDLDIYDIAHDTWTAGTQGGGRLFPTSVTLGSRFFIWGGLNNAREIQNKILIYSPVTNLWKDGTSITGRFLSTTTVGGPYPYNLDAYTIGGRLGGDTIATNEIIAFSEFGVNDAPFVTIFP